VHHPITLGRDWIRAEQVGNPPCLQRAIDSEAIADPKPPREPSWKGTPKLEGGGSQSERIRSKVDESGNQKLTARKLLPDTPHVIKFSERNPIV
jgi:hypothetical protein